MVGRRKPGPLPDEVVEQIRACARRGLTMKETAKELDRTYGSVYQAATKRGIEFATGRRGGVRQTIPRASTQAPPAADALRQHYTGIKRALTWR